MTDKIESFGDGGVLFAGPVAVNVYRATAIGAALRLYAKTGLKVNRAYTPTAMLKAANEITGQSFKRGQYAEAGEALRTWAQAQAAAIKTAQS